MKQKKNVTKWRNTDIYLSFFTAMSCAVSSGVNDTQGIICTILKATAIAALLIFFLLLPLRKLYDEDRQLPKWLRITALILRTYALAIMVTAGIYGFIQLKDYAENAKNH